MSDRLSPPNPDHLEKVTGRTQFITDIEVPGMLHGKVLRSTVPHAMIKSIDVSAALAIPGVVAVLTGADIVGLNHHWGPSLKDRPLIAIDRVVKDILQVRLKFVRFEKFTLSVR